MQRVVAVFMRLMFAAGSFHNVKIIGKRADPKEAPILVAAPHSSFFDSILAANFNPPTIVAKKETANLPLMGSKF